LKPSLTRRLKNDFLTGVFAPRGWHCQTWSGSNESFIIVTPSVPPQIIPREPVTGQMTTSPTGAAYAGPKARGSIDSPHSSRNEFGIAILVDWKLYGLYINTCRKYRIEARKTPGMNSRA
jgi:hypothetical protein